MADTEVARMVSLKSSGDDAKYGIKVRKQEETLEAINQEILQDDDYQDVEDLEDKLKSFKDKFLEFDTDPQGNIDLMGLKRMLEKLGQAKTHLELKKIIREVDKTNSGVICYRDFVTMMVGPKTSVLKLILMFEEKMKDGEKPSGPPPKRDLSSLP